MTENPVTAVTREVAKHMELKERLEAIYQDLDPQALVDTIEGETDLQEVLQKVANQVLEYQALAAATKERLDALKARKDRLEQSAETLRAIILQAMDTAGIQKITGPEMTLSCRQTSGALVIDDESKIPSAFFEKQPPKLDKALVKECLESRDDNRFPNFEGAHVSNGSLSLTIRVK